MKQIKRLNSTCRLAAGALFIWSGFASTSPVAAQVDCGPAWRVVPSPNDARGIDNILEGTAAVSANDVWAVGFKTTGINMIEMLILHWDGVQWSIVPHPDLGPGKPLQALFDVSAVSANHIWAVGHYSSETDGNLRTLTIHWDGTEWSEVPSPEVAVRDNTLRGLVAVSANDIWAVGSSRNASGEPRRTLILRWNGTQWDVVPSPNGGVEIGGIEGENFLLGARVVSPNDVWAVGFYLAGEGGTGVPQTLTMRWNGSAWNIVPSPNLGTGSYLLAISALSTNDIWGVGYFNRGGVIQTLTMRWNGTTWSIVPSPNVGISFNRLDDVTAVSANEAWAVGFWTDTTNPNYSMQRTLVERWNGTEWSVADSPNIPGADRNRFTGVTVAPPGPSGQRSIWAVGHYGGTATTLVQRYHDPCLEPVQALAAVSRKSHGQAGAFDLALPLTGGPGVEGRKPGANGSHQIVFKFATAVTFGDAAVTPASGKTAETDGPPIRSADGKAVTVNLKNVSNAQTITVKLLGVSNGMSTNDVAVQMTVQAGDTNGDTRVNVGDTNQTKANSGSLTNDNNFRTDVNLDGRINVGDTNFVKAHAGSSEAGQAQRKQLPR